MMLDFLNGEFQPMSYIVVILITILLISRIWGKKREKKERRQVALEMGFSFCPNIKTVPVDCQPSFDFGLLNSRGTRGIKGGVLNGRDDSNNVLLFDYVSASTEWGTTRQTVACHRVHTKVLPEFELRSESIFDKVFGHRGGLDFDTNPEFSKSYLLRASDENSVRALFHQDILNYFEREKGWCVEASKDWLVVYRSGDRLKPRQLPRFLDESKRICMLFAKK